MNSSWLARLGLMRCFESEVGCRDTHSFDIHSPEEQDNGRIIVFLGYPTAFYALGLPSAG